MRQAEPVPISIPDTPSGVLQACHPDWRGVLASARAFRDPTVEASDLRRVIPALTSIPDRPATLVIQGWPPGAGDLARAASDLGVSVQAVFHSSPAQHGIDGGESEAVSEMLALAAGGTVARVGTVKAGTAEAFRALGYDVAHVPNRVPVLPKVEPATVPDGTNVGILLAPIWRKNVTTQILAAIQNGWHPFVMERPHVPYLDAHAVTELGELPHAELLAVQAAMDIVFNVTLSECHPMMPMEAYRLGIPCLMSRTSDLFIDTPDLHQITTVAEADEPNAIANAAVTLLERRDDAVAMANAALDATDATATDRWLRFTGRK